MMRNFCEVLNLLTDNYENNHDRFIQELICFEKWKFFYDNQMIVMNVIYKIRD